MTAGPGLNIKLDGLQQAQQDFGGFVNTLQTLDSRLQKTATGFNNVEKNIASAGTAVANALNKINKAAGSVGAGSGQNALVGAKAAADLINVLNTIPPFKNDEAIKSVNRAIKGIKDLFSTFSDPELQPSRLGRIFSIFGKNTRITDQLSGFTNFINLVVKSLSALENIASPASLRGVDRALSSIRLLMDQLTTLGKDLPPPTTFNKLQSVFGRNTRLSESLSGIRNFTRILADALAPLANLKVGNLTAVTEGIRAIGSILNTFNQLSKDLAGSGGGGGLNSVVSNLSRVFGRDTRLTELLRGIRPFTRLLGEALSELARIKIPNTEKFNAISRSLIAIAKLFDVASKGFQFSPERLKTFVSAIREIGIALSEGFSGGIKSEIDFDDLGKDNAEEYLKGARDGFETGSPSRAMFRIGGDVVRGFQNGIERFNPLGLARDFGSKFLSGLRSGFSGLRNVFGDALSAMTDFRDRVVSTMNDIGRSLVDSGQRNIVGGFQKVVGGGIVSFLQGRFITDVVGGFDQTLAQIQIFGRLTQDELAEVESALAAFSAATIFDPVQSAQAFLGLQKAGLDTASALASIDFIGFLAAADPLLDLSAATDLVVASVNGFNLTFDETERVVNAFVGAADISTAEVTTLGSALGFVANDAQALGISIEDTSAALAVLNDRGIRGERAGTGLRAVLASLAAPTDAAQASLDALGISVFDAQGNFVGLDNLLEQFSTGLEGLSTQEINELLAGIGDRNAVSAIKALIATTGDGALVFNEYAAAMDGANTAADLAEAQMDTFRGRLISLQGSIQNLLIRAFRPLLNEVFKPLIEDAIEIVNNIADMDEKFLKLAAGVAVLIPAATTVLGIFQLLSGPLLILVGRNFQFIALALNTIFSPARLALLFGFGAAFIAITGVFIALLPSIIAARENFEGLISRVSELFSALSELGQAVFGFVKRLFGAESSLSRLAGLGESAEGSFNIVAAAIDAIADAMSRVTGLVGDVTDFFNFLNLNTDIETGVAFEVESKESDLPINNLLARRLELQEQITQERNAAIEAELALLDVIAAGDTGLTGIVDELARAEALRPGAGLELLDEVINNPNFSQFQQEFQDNILAVRDGFDQVIDRAEDFEGVADTVARATDTITVKSGDNLTRLAEEYGVTIQDILDANPEISDPNLIFTGQELVIPGVTLAEGTASALEEELAEIESQIRLDEKLGISAGLESDRSEAFEKEQERIRTSALATQAILQSRFARNPIFKAIFGDDPATVFTVVDRVNQVFTDLRVTVAKIASTVSTGATKFFDTIITFVTNPSFKTAASAFFDFAVAIVSLVANLTASVGLALFNVILDGLTLAAENATPILDTLARVFTFLATRLNLVTAALPDIISNISAFISTVSGIGLDVLSAIFGIIDTPIAFLAGGLADILSAVVGTAFDLLTGELSFAELGQDILDGLLDGLVGAVNIGIEIATAIVQGFKEFLGIASPSTVFRELATDIIDGLLDGLAALPSLFFAIGVDILDTLFNDVLGFGPERTQPIIDAFLSIRDALSNLKSSVIEFTQSAGVQALVTIFSDIRTAASDLFSAVTSGGGGGGGGGEGDGGGGEGDGTSFLDRFAEIAKDIAASGVVGLFSGIALAINLIAEAIRFLTPLFDALVLAGIQLADVVVASLSDSFESVRNSIEELMGEGGITSLISFLGVLGAIIAGPTVIGIISALAGIIVGTIVPAIGLFLIALNVVENTIEPIVQIISSLGDVLRGVFTGDMDLVRESLVSLIDGIFDLLVGLGVGILEGLADTAGVIATFLDTLFGTDFFVPLVDGIVNAFASIGEFLSPILTGLFSIVTDLFINPFITFFSSAFNGLVNIISGIFNIIAGIISGDFGQVLDGVGNLLEGILDLFLTLPRTLLRVFDGIFGTSILAGFNGVIESIIDIFNDVVNAVKKFLGIASPSTVFIQIGEDILNGLISAFLGLGPLLLRLFTGGVKALISAVPVIARAFGDLITSGFRALIRIAPRIGALFGEAISALFGALPALGGAALQVGEFFLNILGEGIKLAIGAGGQILSGLGDLLGDAINGLLSIPDIDFGEALSSVSDGIAAFGDAFSDFTGIDITGITDAISGVFGTIGDLVSGDIGFGDILGSAGDFLGNLFSSITDITTEDVLSTIGGFGTIVTTALSGLLSAAFSILNFLGIDTEGAEATTSDILDKMFGAFTSLTEGDISGFLQTFLDLAESAVKGLFATVFSLANLLGIDTEGAESSTNDILEEIFGAFTSLTEGDISGFLQTFLDLAESAVKGLFATVFSLANLLGIDTEGAEDAVSAVIDTIFGGLNDLVPGDLSFEGFKTAIVDAFDALSLDGIFEFLAPESLIEPLIDTVLGLLLTVLLEIETGINRIIDGINNLLDKVGLGDIERVSLTGSIEDIIFDREQADIEAAAQELFDGTIEGIELTVSPDVELDPAASQDLADSLSQQFLAVAGIEGIDREAVDATRAAIFNELNQAGSETIEAFDFAGTFGLSAGNLEAAREAGGEVFAAFVSEFTGGFQFDTLVFPQIIEALNEGQLTVGDIELFDPALAEQVSGELATDITSALNEALAMGIDPQTAFDVAFTRIAESGIDPALIDLSGIIDFTNEDEVSTAIDEAVEAGLSDEFIDTIIADAVASGSDFAQGLADGIAENRESVATAASDTATAAQDEVTEIWEAESPSQWAIRQGKFFAEGLAIGLTEGMALVRPPFEMLLGLMDALRQRFLIVQSTIIGAFTTAGLSMTANVIIMQAAIGLLINSLNELQFVAATVGGTISGIGRGIGGGGTAQNGQAGIPEFQSGGFTGDGSEDEGFLAMLHRGEFIVPANGMLIARDPEFVSAFEAFTNRMMTGSIGNLEVNNIIQEPQTVGSDSLGIQSSGAGGSGEVTNITVTFEGDIVLPENATGEITPDMINEGMQLYFRQNPLQHTLRGGSR